MLPWRLAGHCHATGSARAHLTASQSLSVSTLKSTERLSHPGISQSDSLTYM